MGHWSDRYAGCPPGSIDTDDTADRDCLEEMADPTVAALLAVIGDLAEDEGTLYSLPVPLRAAVRAWVDVGMPGRRP